MVPRSRQRGYSNATGRTLRIAHPHAKNGGGNDQAGYLPPRILVIALRRWLAVRATYESNLAS